MHSRLSRLRWCDGRPFRLQRGEDLRAGAAIGGLQAQALLFKDDRAPRLRADHAVRGTDRMPARQQQRLREGAAHRLDVVKNRDDRAALAMPALDQRQKVGGGARIDGGWLVEDGLKPGERVVVDVRPVLPTYQASDSSRITTAFASKR